MKNKTKTMQADDDPRRVEAAKTNRLRALRLAKEAEEKEAAAREAASQPRKTSKAKSTR
jgi:hypothetical protein